MLIPITVVGREMTEVRNVYREFAVFCWWWWTFEEL